MAKRRTKSVPPAASARVARRRAPVRVGHLLAGGGLLVIVLLVYGWLMTYGDWGMTQTEDFGIFYDAQADAFLHASWDVPWEAISPEAFIRDDKAYGYFGPAPAIPRLALNALFPSMWGCWSRWSALLAGIATLWGCLALLNRTKPIMAQNSAPDGRTRWAQLLFLLGIGLGSTLVFLESRAFIYHEASLWGNALAVLAYAQLLAFVIEPKTWRLMLAGWLAYVACFTRITCGVGPMLALAALAAVHLVGAKRAAPADASPPRWRIAATALGIALLTLLTFVGINHAKFGTWLELAPLRYYAQLMADPPRAARIGNAWMRLGNCPTAACAYLSPATVKFDGYFPWVWMTRNIHVFSCTHFDGAGALAGVGDAMPWLTLLAIVGVGSVALGAIRSGPNRPAFRGAAIILLCAAIGTLPLFAHCMVAMRYEHDLFPLLTLAGGFGLHRLLALRSVVARRAWAAALGLALCFSIWANLAFAITFQRSYVWDVPRPKLMEFIEVTSRVDHWFGRKD